MGIRRDLQGVLPDIMDNVACHPGDDLTFVEATVGHYTPTDRLTLEHYSKIRMFWKERIFAEQVRVQHGCFPQVWKGLAAMQQLAVA